jgi:hypothetical protein
MPSVGYNAAYASAANRFSLTEAIALHARLEAACDDLIQKQDSLIRTVALRCRPEPAASADRARAAVPGMMLGALAQNDRSEGIPPDAFAPLASARFVHEASAGEAEGIEALEFKIAQTRAAMRKIEVDIETYSPATTPDIARKLAFLSALLIDGGEVDLDAYARLAETGAGMLLEALESTGFF